MGMVHAKTARAGPPAQAHTFNFADNSTACFNPQGISFPQGGPLAALTVDLVGALSDLDDITVRIADVAAYLAVFGYRFRDELRSSTFP